MHTQSIKKRKSLLLLAMLCMLSALALPCYGAVIFEDNFDAKPDWAPATDGCVGVGNEGPLTCPDVPANWSFYKNDDLSAPNVLINGSTTTDHSADSGRGAGKSLVVKIKSDTAGQSGNYYHDGILAKFFNASYDELYIRVWIKTGPWQYSSGSQGNKVIRVSNWNQQGNFFHEFSSGYNLFNALYQWASTDSGTANWGVTNRCELDNYYCSFAADVKNDSNIPFPGSQPVTSVFADGQWHRYDFHWKMNSPYTSANGIQEVAYDGKVLMSVSDMRWRQESSSNSLGWNNIRLGGNSTQWWSGSPSEIWYAMDDLVVSTTPIDGAFPGNGSYVIGGAAPVSDATAPTVAISAPSAGAAVSGIASVTASASDNVGVTKVEFYVNGVLQSSDTSTPYLLSWDTTRVANGSYALSAKAYDAAGNVGQSSALSVTVNNVVSDTIKPTVVMGSPGSNATVSGSVTVSASASDNVGVTKVEFYDNNALSAVVNSAPFSFSWNTTSVTNGAHTLVAKAYDAAGNMGQSAAIGVTVNNPVADTTLPLVAITAPVSAATVSGTVTVSATASDNIGVSKVEFYVNGALKATDTALPYSYGWNTTTMANGSYAVSSKAYDAAGNVGQSAVINVTVNNQAADTTAPATAIVSPASGAIVSGTLSVTGSASDNVGVARVEFYVNGVLQATDTAAPYTFSWNTAAVANGAYTLMTRAYDAAGNMGQSAALPVTVNNAVLTPPAAQSTYTLWDATAQPTVVSDPDGSAVELGVKIRSDVDGYITGIRFYKSSSNTGTHVANLWSAKGTRLATATFKSETASGWQQVNFTTPVAIKANTVYVASYHTNKGHYSADQNYFNGKGVDNGPLHALADGVSGRSGVYAYGSYSKFPTQGWNSSNYWVDVIFKK